MQHVLPQSSESSDLSDGPITVQEFMEVKSALTASEAKIQQLLKVNCHLSEELRLMQGKVSKNNMELMSRVGIVLQIVYTFSVCRNVFKVSMPLIGWFPSL